MKKSKIADTLYVPIKDGKYLLNGKGIVRVYKSMKTLEKYCKDYDGCIIYERVQPTATEIYERYRVLKKQVLVL